MRSVEHKALAISVCLPNLNTVRFLPERIQSIEDQSFRDFEVILYDSYSDDGSYQLLQAFAAKDPRVVLVQQPRFGLYPSWNNCLRMARGKWIYLATSDDTMKPGCLETLLAAAEANPRAKIVTSLPWVIDSDGGTAARTWDREARWLAGRPYRTDAFLQPETEIIWGLIVGTPTMSITQMLIHREVFETVGYFPSEFGSVGDYYWQMLALQKVPWFHVGQELASWRRHANQATKIDEGAKRRAMAQMALRLFNEGVLADSPGIVDALGYCVGMADVDIPANIPLPARKRAQSVRSSRSALRRHPGLALARARLFG